MTATSARRWAPPTALVAELTHRCPLACPYCSNPRDLVPREAELDTATWMRVMREAAALGVRRAYFSGGEPGMRKDLVEIVAEARDAGLHTTLLTSGVGVGTRTLRDLWEAGLDHVQVSIQDAGAVLSDHVAGAKGAFQRKLAMAAETVRIGLPLTIGHVLHRANIDQLHAMVERAASLGASRIVIEPVACHGWAIVNRGRLALAAEQMQRTAAEIALLRERMQSRIRIDTRGGDDEAAVHIAPSGVVAPGDATGGDPVHPPWNVREHSLRDIWERSPAFDRDGHTDALRVSPAFVRDSETERVSDDTPYVYRR